MTDIFVILMLDRAFEMRTTLRCLINASLLFNGGLTSFSRLKSECVFVNARSKLAFSVDTLSFKLFSVNLK
jgi:hypothetical protein